MKLTEVKDKDFESSKTKANCHKQRKSHKTKSLQIKSGMIYIQNAEEKNCQPRILYPVKLSLDINQENLFTLTVLSQVAAELSLLILPL